MNKIGINVNKNVTYGTDSYLNNVALAGFDSVFSCVDDDEFVGHVAAKCYEHGLKYEYLHAPWNKINELWFDNLNAEDVLNNFKHSVDLAAEYDIPIIISHISSKEDAPHVTDAGLRNFDKFAAYAASKNRIVAVENQRKLGNIATILEVYDKTSNVQFCWDVGHEKCFAFGREYMPLFADRCVATHIHDNNCKYNVDEHILPWDGNIDFRRTAELIHNTGYTGTLMLEIDLPHEGSDKYRDLSVEQFCAKAFAAINRLRIISEY